MASDAANNSPGPSSLDAQALEVFIRGLVGPECASPPYEGPERRAHPRYVKPIPIVALPVDEHNQPTGPALKLLAHDISAGGACLLHHEPVAARRLVLEIGPVDRGQVRLVLEVLRARQLADGTHEIAGRFVNW